MIHIEADLQGMKVKLQVPDQAHPVYTAWLTLEQARIIAEQLMGAVTQCIESLPLPEGKTLVHKDVERW
jgi:hypothetical protein